MNLKMLYPFFEIYSIYSLKKIRFNPYESCKFPNFLVFVSV